MLAQTISVLTVLALPLPLFALAPPNLVPLALPVGSNETNATTVQSASISNNTTNINGTTCASASPSPVCCDLLVTVSHTWFWDIYDGLTMSQFTSWATCPSLFPKSSTPSLLLSFPTRICQSELDATRSSLLAHWPIGIAALRLLRWVSCSILSLYRGQKNEFTDGRACIQEELLPYTIGLDCATAASEEGPAPSAKA